MVTFFKSTGRALQYIVGVGFWNLCMLIVIATLCFIAIPKDFSDPISCRLFNVHCLPKSATSLPLIAPQQPVAQTSPSAGSKNQLANNTSPADIAAIAKMTLDASKDKYDSIKDTQDKLFSLIAALSALLTLLGFKGVESFFKARTVAIDAAKDAKGVVLSLEEQKQQYSEDNRVELAISTGAALRDIADMYEVIMRKTSANPAIDPTKDKEYIGYLEQAETHLRFAAYENTSSDKKITARALGTLGNVLYRLKRYTEALEVNKLILKKYNASDIDACFNMACYCSKIAEEFSLQNRHQDADKHAHQSIDHARTYISMETAPSKAKIFLDGERDLDFIRKHMLSGYTALFS